MTIKTPRRGISLIQFAHAATLDAVNGNALKPRKGPWDEEAWERACAKFYAVMGTEDPAELADRYAGSRA